MIKTNLTSLCTRRHRDCSLDSGHVYRRSSVEHLHRLASPFARNCALAASILDAGSYGYIKRCCYLIIIKIYTPSSSTVNCIIECAPSVARIFLFTPLRLVLLSFYGVGKTGGGISIKYIKPIPKRERCIQRREISDFVERIVVLHTLLHSCDSFPAAALCKFCPLTLTEKAQWRIGLALITTSINGLYYRLELVR